MTYLPHDAPVEIAFAVPVLTQQIWTARIRPMTNEEKTEDEKKYAARAELGEALSRNLKQAFDATMELLRVSDLHGNYDGTVLNQRGYLFQLAMQLNDHLQPLAYAVPECRERGVPGYHARREELMRQSAVEMSGMASPAVNAAMPLGAQAGGR